ncbi:probable LRR receptor-like serine/threonine-protein kinase At5g48740 [Cryptomeria japonica]|uniref:probable LRR receptor-like serine/threonine-protein kinase At5g48740 n=1 Tax=Cryptomeria japonica TaxID=3369 RepID=UPI0027D9F2A2|nr:probable LRR receptor-like serine/threonine-protein kinase At5g48740 [Cryptomeria japonica]XP_059071622.1 probable LRR receptor-like serine/threonine-protein kinase At5g48740 [Cryptomeria japonica]
MGYTAMVWVVGLIILWCVAFINAQPGFLSIVCGGKSDYTDENGIEWVTDDNYIEVGQKVEIANSSLPVYQQSVRVFPRPLSKSCYQLPITPKVPHLVRIWFYNGNYSGESGSLLFKFSIETTEMLSLRSIISRGSPLNLPSERILFSSGNALFICLIRTSETVNPFISAIELRTLQQGMYPQAKPGTMLRMDARYDAGGNSTIRYPQDQFDRVWVPLDPQGTQNVVLQGTISTNNTHNFPPSGVMQTAATTLGNESIILYFTQISNPLMLLYFAESHVLNVSGSMTMEVGQIRLILSLERDFSAEEIGFNFGEMPIFGRNFTFDNIKLYRSSNTGADPLINALEYYQLITTELATYSADVDALAAMKNQLKINDWISDPCFGLPWEGIQCNNSPSSVRVSEINLTGRNLTGSIPTVLAQMTELINIHLQNNSLSGELPDWLAQLDNLKELFIDHNNFSGVIPQLLLQKNILTYEGNKYLSNTSQSSTHFNSKRSNVGIIVGAIGGGIIVIAFILIVSIIVYRRRFSKKEIVLEESKGSASGSKSVNILDNDYSVVLVPNPSKSRAFTLEEMMTSTENFSYKIGQGGFGSVFWGKLQSGKQIAVKVLSLFSKQGVLEFLNEIDLLSRVHHKNLVSLLGYCNESRELMLVYEYMFGGSLKDHLYGNSGGQYPNLDWKTRLDIALDAAQGLEYLHVSCTPKIIHRDIKTANILLDENLNGKLADFGLSRVTSDGEDSHVSTAVKGTAGYLDPEYFKTEVLTDKSDVYSFGVVLLEIICGRAPIDAKLSTNEINLVRWVIPFVEIAEYSEKFSEIVDKRLVDNYSIKSIAHVAKLAIRCVADNPSSRPSASEVLAEMKAAVQYHATSMDISEEIDIDYQDQQISPAAHRDISSRDNSSYFSRSES